MSRKVQVREGEWEYQREVLPQATSLFSYLDSTMDEMKDMIYTKYIPVDDHLKPLDDDVASHLPFNFHCGWVGVFGYDSLGVPGSSSTTMEKGIPGGRRDSKHVPDAAWIFADRMLVWDHETALLYQLAVIPVDSQHSEHVANVKQWFHDTLESLTHSFSLGASTTEEAREVVSCVKKCESSMFSNRWKLTRVLHLLSLS